jgi:hypothetical protein
MIISNQVECLKCGDRPFSAHRHAFVTCECGAVSVDGGMEYLRRVYDNREDYKDISIECTQEHYDDLVEAMNDPSRNELGKICNILRVVRDNKEIDDE